MREYPSDNDCSDAIRHCQKSAEAIVAGDFPRRAECLSKGTNLRGITGKALKSETRKRTTCMRAGRKPRVKCKRRIANL